MEEKRKDHPDPKKKTPKKELPQQLQTNDLKTMMCNVLRA